MYVAVVLYSPPGNKSLISSGNAPFVATSASLAAGAAEAFIANGRLRSQYPSYNYTVVVGELTHKSVPPESKVELTEFKD